MTRASFAFWEVTKTSIELGAILGAVALEVFVSAATTVASNRAVRWCGLEEILKTDG